MLPSETELAATHWPDSASEVPLQPVSRLIYASLCKVDGPLLDEMRRIRDQSLRHNRPAGLRVVLLHMSGWFVEWIEGPEAGIRALIDHVAQDPRHQGLRVVHHSLGRPRLFRPWIGTLVQSDEGPTAFARRLFTLLDRPARERVPEPAQVWSRLCAPRAPDMPQPGGDLAQAMLLSAQGSNGFELLQVVAHHHRRALVRRRCTGAADDAPDVESDYLDLPTLGRAGWRLTANARKGLAMGLAHAELPDLAAVVVLLGDNVARNRHLIERVLSACRQVHHAPAIVGLGTPGQVTAELQELVERQGLPWVGAHSASQHPVPRDLWAALAPALQSIG